MKHGATTIFSRVLGLVMIAGAIGYVIFTDNDNGTENTRTAYNHASAQDGFDPNVLPAPAAGREIVYNCKDMIYQTSKNGINYVREYGEIYNAAIVDDRFGLYKLDYGHLLRVDNSALDPHSIGKLRYALRNCNETYIRSGAHILTSATLSGSQA